MDILSLELIGVILMMLIALGILLRLAAEEITEDVAEFKRRNRWRKRYKHHKRRKR